MYEYSVRLASVHDGDTLHLDWDLGRSLWLINDLNRYFGYDAPELGRVDRVGEQARDWVVAWFAAHSGPYLGHSVKDRSDKYGRYFVGSLVAADGHELLNDQIVAGWLKPYSGVGPKPVWP